LHCLKAANDIQLAAFFLGKLRIFAVRASSNNY
jgi:hypothetical protein